LSNKPEVVLSAIPETIECPLCLGEGRLKRTEILDRLGVKDFARVAQLSAEEVFRLLQQKYTHDSQHLWSRFDNELTKRTAEIELRHRSELQALSGEKTNLSRQVENCLREVAELREKNQELEAEMSKVARVGKREEMDFAEEARTWAGICISEKLARNGDFILAYRDASGVPLEPRMLIDNKDKAIVGENDIDKLVRDAGERSIPVAVLVAHNDEQLRQVDRDNRWARKDGVWILRTTRQWLPRDLDVLKPLFERMRLQGSDLLERNAALGDEVRRTFADLDRIESELKKATKAISSASGLVTKYRGGLQELCDNAAGTKMPSGRELSRARII
jgi:predicted nuclease with TOPRIM domain